MTEKDLEIQQLRAELKRYKDAEKAGRLVVLPDEDYTFKIRGDLALGIIIANCRAARNEAALKGENHETDSV